MEVRKVSAGEFKAKCLKLMDAVKLEHTTIVITKYGRPIVKMVPLDEQPDKKPKIFGLLRGTVKINGDIIKPIDEDWNADKS